MCCCITPVVTEYTLYNSNLFACNALALAENIPATANSGSMEDRYAIFDGVASKCEQKSTAW